ncbi:NAD(P)-binding domain-containing protein [Haloterrigena alkaliphila]|uniref:6-phosphogluconate dehydrogenase NADP-binding domain-containing protein n=1 Tax=Haloterrigena alkaliphila TaxID=2816475 RepID=A0A8A2V7C6_9EURY|nr:NAD(P)-binding domain-containing protein [Haloterrigena alkaliphila]QSW97713.1 NAD(P)-binding domain-containing protein [Haloterrigena alkaliphila]
MSGTEPTPTVGVIGLGIMGGEMARNLVDGGYDLVVNDVDRDAVETMVEYGADARSSPSKSRPPPTSSSRRSRRASTSTRSRSGTTDSSKARTTT